MTVPQEHEQISRFIVSQKNIYIFSCFVVHLESPSSEGWGVVGIDIKL